MSAAAQLHAETNQRRWQFVRIMLALQVAALVAMYLSGHWDAAEHAKGAVDRFWYPPHYGIYFAILMAALLSLAGLIALLWNSPDPPFTALKRNQALTLVVIANALSFTGAPADALWHEVFGIDLTVWSPPHLHLLFGQVLSALGCIVYFLDDDADESIKVLVGRSVNSTRGLRTAVALGTWLTALLLAAFLFFEYEAGILSRDVIARPTWAYPLLWPLFVTTVFGLVEGSSRRIGMVTAVALLYDAARIAALVFDRTLLDYRGTVGYPLVVPALIYELTVWSAFRRYPARGADVSYLGGAMTTLALVISTPLFWSWIDVAPELTVIPWPLYWPLGLFSGLVGAVAGWKGGSLLRRLRPDMTSPTNQSRQAEVCCAACVLI